MNVNKWMGVVGLVFLASGSAQASWKLSTNIGGDQWGIPNIYGLLDSRPDECGSISTNDFSFQVFETDSEATIVSFNPDLLAVLGYPAATAKRITVSTDQGGDFRWFLRQVTEDLLRTRSESCSAEMATLVEELRRSFSSDLLELLRLTEEDSSQEYATAFRLTVGDRRLALVVLVRSGPGAHALVLQSY